MEKMVINTNRNKHKQTYYQPLDDCNGIVDDVPGVLNCETVRTQDSSPVSNPDGSSANSGNSISLFGIQANLYVVIGVGVAILIVCCVCVVGCCYMVFGKKGNNVVRERRKRWEREQRLKELRMVSIQTLKSQQVQTNENDRKELISSNNNAFEMKDQKMANNNNQHQIFTVNISHFERLGMPLPPDFESSNHEEQNEHENDVKSRLVGNSINTNTNNFTQTPMPAERNGVYVVDIHPQQLPPAPQIPPQQK